MSCNRTLINNFYCSVKEDVFFSLSSMLCAGTLINQVKNVKYKSYNKTYRTTFVSDTFFC